tara:strand:+ start:1583 stop:1726 length:144 start_codon:yes stop_codon:yes gene_type:complete
MLRAADGQRGDDEADIKTESVGLDARDDAAFGLTPTFRRISGLGISP